MQMDINQEVSNVLGAGDAVDVRFSKRQLETSVMVEDGQMIVLGGLMSESTVESESKVPFLGDIPIVGWLFRSSTTKLEKRNLMVFIKPSIIRSGAIADGITQRKYNFIRAEQLYKASEGSKVPGDHPMAVIPAFGKNMKHSAKVQNFIDQMNGQPEEQKKVIQ